MTFTELAAEYERSAHLLDDAIERRKAALRNNCSVPDKTVLHELRALMEMRIEAMHTADYLRNYYKFSEDHHDAQNK